LSHVFSTEWEDVMKSALLVLAVLFPGLGFAATLSGSIVESAVAVNLGSVGTLDWARWPGYTHKSNLISNITVTGMSKTYTNDPRIIGDASGVKLLGKSQFQFTVAATTLERTLIIYVGGWNATGRISVTMPGVPEYSAAVQSTATFDKIVTIRYRADTNTTLTVRYIQTSDVGSLRLQAAALQGSTAPPPTGTGSARLTWVKPTTNTNGTPLTNLTGYKVYWGTTRGAYTKSYVVNNPAATALTVGNLSAGTWYFTVTALAGGTESVPSNVASKAIQ
jgi:hypothetical protein